MQDIGDVFRILYPASSYFLVEIRAILWLAKHVPIRQLLSDMFTAILIMYAIPQNCHDQSPKCLLRRCVRIFLILTDSVVCKATSSL